MELIELINKEYDLIVDNIVIEDGFVRVNRPGHTKEVAQLQYCHNGRATANYYAVGIVAGKLDEEFGLQILKAIASLQVKDFESHLSGGFRWYRQETQISDTNAAFFILRAIVIMMKLGGDRVPTSHLPLIREMCELGVGWFSRECKSPSLYYPNKIISDGALLLALSSILENENYYREGVEFFERWEEYTRRRGWGYGENLSRIYTSIILTGLKLASICLKDNEKDLRNRLLGWIEKVSEYICFHDGMEFVPTIRSYNFDGHLKQKSISQLIAQESDISQEELWQRVDPNPENMMTLLLFTDRLRIVENNTKEEIKPLLPTPRTRVERVFDNSFAYTWVGNNGRMGSLNKFPVIPGCYQWPTWGLGWQTFPVSVGVTTEQIGYLRWFVKEGQNIRTHPAQSQHQAYLSPALFKEANYPNVYTRCAQQDNAMVVVRILENVHNVASEIADEWVFHRFEGEVEVIDINEGEQVRKWIVIRYKKACIALTALQGIQESSRERNPAQVQIVHDQNILRLRQVLFCEIEIEVIHPRLETGWAVLFIDDAPSGDELERKLEGVRISDISKKDYEVSREPYTEIREITLSQGGEHKVTLKVDPHYMD